MKKNLMSVIILALVFVNVVLSGIIVFTLVPQTKQANELITRVCEAINLEVNSGATNGLANLPVTQIATYLVNGGESININLAPGEDDKAHYAIVALSLNLNNQSEEYVANSTATLSDKESIIVDKINTVVRSYTLEELKAKDGMETLKKDILKQLQNMFGADYIVGISFMKFNTD